MMTLLRWVLLLVIFVVLVSTVVAGVGSSNSGVSETIALVVFGVLLLVAASYVHRLGRGSTTE